MHEAGHRGTEPHFHRQHPAASALPAPCSVSSPGTLQREFPAPCSVSSRHPAASVPSTLQRQLQISLLSLESFPRQPWRRGGGANCAELMKREQFVASRRGT